MVEMDTQLLPLINNLKRSQPEVVRQHDNNSTIHTIYNYSDTTDNMQCPMASKYNVITTTE